MAKKRSGRQGTADSWQGRERQICTTVARAGTSEQERLRTSARNEDKGRQYERCERRKQGQETGARIAPVADTEPSRLTRQEEPEHRLAPLVEGEEALRRVDCGT